MKGTVTMMDTHGNPIGILNAEELTAFRTALASTILFQKREHVHTITVFGAGRQAFWHIRLALLFKPDQIKHVNIINRSLDRFSAQLPPRARSTTTSADGARYGSAEKSMPAKARSRS